MAVSIRLQRHGRRNRPFYHIVAADRRKKRDGLFIEKLGIYDPLENPSLIELNTDRIKYWYGKGAILSNTVKNIVKIKNVSVERYKCSPQSSKES